MSDDGHRVSAVDEVVMDQSGAICPGPKGSAPEKESGTFLETLDSAREEGRHIEAVISSGVSPSEERLNVTSCFKQVGEKIEARNSEPQKITDGGDEDECQQARSSLPVNTPGQAAEVSQLSKRAQKKLLRKQKFKEQRKAKKSGNFTNNANPGFDSDLFTETDYYFENGLRKVYPYHFTFSTYAKERWYGKTLQAIFEHEFRADSPDNFKLSVDKGLLRVNGKMAKPDHVIQNGDLIEHHIHRHENPVSGQPLEVIADTEDVVVINKPASIPCHPCGKFRFNSIVFIMGKELGYANLRNIYRLDRLTSGVLIMGKTAKKTKELENHILHRQVQKEYLARVIGEFPEEEITVDKSLDCLSYKMTLWRVVDKGGKPSRTTFKRLSYNGQTSLVKCFPHTGRTHQIRVHLQYLGHPIVNDPYYNSPAWGPERGKGGCFDVPIEELVKRIMKEHNVGMWYDGENPLFHERLGAIQDDDDINTAPPGPENVDDIDISMLDSAADKADTATVTAKRNGSKPASDHSTPAKKVRLDYSGSVPSTEGVPVADNIVPTQCTVVHSPSLQYHAVITDEPVSCINTHRADNLTACAKPLSESSVCLKTGASCDPETGMALSPACETANASAPSSADASAPSSADASTPLSAHSNVLPLDPSVPASSAVAQEECLKSAGKGEWRSAGVVERRGFDPQCWIPDLHCQSCRLKYIDPKPSDLLLYLHALRYKGPGWDYSTALPNWAEDSWQEPEDYAKYLQ